MTRNINVNLFRDDTSGSTDEISGAVTNGRFWVVMCCPGPMKSSVHDPLMLGLIPIFCSKAMQR